MGQYHPTTILIQGDFALGIEVFGWYIDPNGIKKLIYSRISYPTCVKKMQNPHYIYLSGIRKR